MLSPVFSPGLEITQQWESSGIRRVSAPCGIREQWAVLEHILPSPLGNPSCRGDPPLTNCLNWLWAYWEPVYKFGVLVEASQHGHISDLVCAGA